MWTMDCYVLCVIRIRSNILCLVFFFQAEDGIRDLVRSRGLGDVYKRQAKKRKDRNCLKILFKPGLHAPEDLLDVAGFMHLLLSLIHI